MENQEIAKVLNQIADFYEEDTSRWTQGTFARDDNDVPVNLNSDKAVCWCLAGAILKFTNDNESLTDKIATVLFENLSDGQSAISWNDSFSQTVENVIATLRKIASEL